MSNENPELPWEEVQMGGQSLAKKYLLRTKNGLKSPHMSVLKPFHFILRHLDAKFGFSMLFYHLKLSKNSRIGGFLFAGDHLTFLFTA